jgi:N-acetylneuraminic acid mutarotase
MTSPRGAHAAVLLNNGTVLIMGGYDNGSTALRTAEVYNPATNTFTAISNLMVSPRNELTANLLPDGRVLITGGQSRNIGTNTAEIYDPATGKFTAIPATMSSIRIMHSGCQMQNGHILLSGGTPYSNVVSAFDTVEEFDPTTQSFTTLSKKMSSPRAGHASSLLADGSVFITGGIFSLNGTVINILNTTERFVP